jgi:hypothetical protein
MPGNGFYFPVEEAKVGDRWEIPLNMQNEQFNLTGTINNQITGTRKIIVPAGTYEVFKLEFTSTDFTLSFSPPPELNMSEPMVMETSMRGYEYFEKGTCRVVEASFEQTVSMSLMGQSISVTITIDMTLKEHVK